MDDSRVLFDCKQCGHCCEGEGGIVLSPADMERLCEGLALSKQEFLDTYGVMRNNKWQVRTGSDGNCIFFLPQKGCSVHAIKPSVCRAWPFFHGNMVDAESLFLAKAFCPGIHPDATHAEFVAEGQPYLAEHGLIATNPACEGTALLPACPMSQDNPCRNDAGKA